MVKGYLSEDHQAEILKVLDSVGTIDNSWVLAVTPVEPDELARDTIGPEYMSMISIGSVKPCYCGSDQPKQPFGWSSERPTQNSVPLIRASLRT